MATRIEAILSTFWRDTDTPDAVRALELENWLNVLSDTTGDELDAVWSDHQRNSQRTTRGSLYKPDAGLFYRKVQELRRGNKPKETPQPTKYDDLELAAQAMNDGRPVMDSAVFGSMADLLQHRGMVSAATMEEYRRGLGQQFIDTYRSKELADERMRASYGAAAVRYVPNAPQVDLARQHAGKWTDDNWRKARDIVPT
jgi:hypothetical protein